MQQEATVKKLEGGHALIEVRRKAACGGECGSCHGCAHPEETLTVSAYNDAGAAEGDRVLVESSSRQVLSLAALVYLMPIALMVLGYLLTPGGEGTRVLGALGAFALGIAACVLVSRRMNRRGRVSFHITQIL